MSLSSSPGCSREITFTMDAGFITVIYAASMTPPRTNAVLPLATLLNFAHPEFSGGKYGVCGQTHARDGGRAETSPLSSPFLPAALFFFGDFFCTSGKETNRFRSTSDCQPRISKRMCILPAEQRLTGSSKSIIFSSLSNRSFIL